MALLVQQQIDAPQISTVDSCWQADLCWIKYERSNVVTHSVMASLITCIGLERVFLVSCSWSRFSGSKTVSRQCSLLSTICNVHVFNETDKLFDSNAVSFSGHIQKLPLLLKSSTTHSYIIGNNVRPVTMLLATNSSQGPR